MRGRGGGSTRARSGGRTQRKRAPLRLGGPDHRSVPPWPGWNARAGGGGEAERGEGEGGDRRPPSNAAAAVGGGAATRQGGAGTLPPPGSGCKGVVWPHLVGDGRKGGGNARGGGAPLKTRLWEESAKRKKERPAGTLSLSCSPLPSLLCAQWDGACVSSKQGSAKKITAGGKTKPTPGSRRHRARRLGPRHPARPPLPLHATRHAVHHQPRRKRAVHALQGDDLAHHFPPHARARPHDGPRVKHAHPVAVAPRGQGGGGPVGQVDGGVEGGGLS